MTQIAYLQTMRPVRNAHWHDQLDHALRFEPKYSATLDRFDARAGFRMEDLGAKVRITGEHGSVLVPWGAIAYAEEVAQPATDAETADTVAASPRAKRGGSKP